MTYSIQQFDFSADLLRALLWQYNDASNIESLITQKNEWYDGVQNQFWENWVTDVFDLRTANDFGCSVWAYILNFPVILAQEENTETVDVPFGFGTDKANFSSPSNFANITGSALYLTTEQKRLILRLRYFSMTTSGCVPEINRFLNYLFAEDYGVVYLIDNNDMTQTYVFQFQPDYWLQKVLDIYDILPRPAGVKSEMVVTSSNYFGFGTDKLNFGNGNFNPLA